MTPSEHQKVDSRGKRISNSKKGIKLSDEHKRNISEGQKGKQVSDETRQKIANGHKGKPGVCKGLHWKIVDGKRVYYKEKKE